MSPLAPNRNPSKVLVQLRLDRALMREADHLSIDWDLSRTATVEILLRRGIEELTRREATA